jgi:hypothetical protein
MFDMTTKETQRYLAETYGIRISIRSIHSWCTTGIRGVKLQPTLVRNEQRTHPNRMVRRFTEDALENFVVAIGLRERA